MDCFNIYSALVNMYKTQRSRSVQQVGVRAFYKVVSYVCEDTLRHPPTRQYLSSCVEILGQVCTHIHIYQHRIHITFYPYLLTPESITVLLRE